MEQRWGLPLIAWPSRLRPNAWDLVALPLVLGVLALITWGGMAMGAHYELGEPLPISLDPWRLPEYALRTVLRMAAALLASLVFSLCYAALAAKSRSAEKILIPAVDTTIQVVAVKSGVIRLGIEAPAEIKVFREEVLPEFSTRDVSGIPREWVARVKASLRTNGPGFAAGRMLRDYQEGFYAPESARR